MLELLVIIFILPVWVIIKSASKGGRGGRRRW